MLQVVLHAQQLIVDASEVVSSPCSLLFPLRKVFDLSVEAVSRANILTIVLSTDIRFMSRHHDICLKVPPQFRLVSLYWHLLFLQASLSLSFTLTFRVKNRTTNVLSHHCIPSPSSTTPQDRLKAISMPRRSLRKHAAKTTLPYERNRKDFHKMLELVAKPDMRTVC